MDYGDPNGLNPGAAGSIPPRPAPGQCWNVDALQEGQWWGAAAGLVGGLAVAGVLEAPGIVTALAGTTAKINPRIYEQLEKQLLRNGPKSICKALKSAERTLQQQEDKLPDMKYKPQVESTIENVSGQIETIKQFMKDHGI